MVDCLEVTGDWLVFPCGEVHPLIKPVLTTQRRASTALGIGYRGIFQLDSVIRVIDALAGFLFHAAVNTRTKRMRSRYPRTTSKASPILISIGKATLAITIAFPTFIRATLTNHNVSLCDRIFHSLCL